MNTFVLLPLQEHMAQRCAGKHVQWRGYMTIHVVKYGIIESMGILTVDIRLLIKFDVDKLHDCFHQEVKWTLAIREQLSTLSELD